jgi:hypothetical protein
LQHRWQVDVEGRRGPTLPLPPLFLTLSVSLLLSLLLLLLLVFLLMGLLQMLLPTLQREVAAV